MRWLLTLSAAAAEQLPGGSYHRPMMSDRASSRQPRAQQRWLATCVTAQVRDTSDRGVGEGNVALIRKAWDQ